MRLMNIEIGDLFLINGLVWTVTGKSRNCPLVLENRDRIISMYLYEINHWMDKHKDSKHYPVIK